MSETVQEAVEDFSTVHSVFVRHRNCLLLRADFSPLYVDYYLHLMQHGLKNPEAEDSLLKQLLAFFTLHLVSRPWQEYHAWTLNLKSPMPANFFVSGSSLTEDVVGRAFTEGVRVPEKNMLYAQNLLPNKEPQTSVIILPEADSVEAWIEDYYRQSEQRSARAFDLGNDRFALLTAEPDADEDWLAALTAEDVAKLDETEELKELETRKFVFRCGCSVEKLLPSIRALRKDFEDLLKQDGAIEASCPRCGALYRISREMLDGSARPDIPDAPDSPA